MTAELISIRGARQNNLANVDVDIPRGQLVAITGLSGSGKSSLAFDTLFREGQRRFLETLSAYARQFLGQMEKPDVDHVSGLSPAIAVDQHSVQRGPRSTVGTLTEVHDYLRVLYARAGTAHCPEHGIALAGQTAEAIVQQIAQQFDGLAVTLLAPVVRDRKGDYAALIDEYKKKGYVRARIDGELRRLEEQGPLARYKRHTIEIVIDRLQVGAATQARLREGVDGALRLSSGDLAVHSSASEQSYSTQRSCPQCGIDAPELEPRLFSFNSPHGWCPDCEGLGLLRQPSLAKIVRDPKLSLRAGALAVTRAGGGALLYPHVDFKFLEAVAKANDFDLDTPWKSLPKRARELVLHGTGEERFAAAFEWKGQKYSGQLAFQRRFAGVLPALDKAWKSGGRRKLVERFLEYARCPSCEGARLNPFARAVRFAGLSIAEWLRRPVDELPALLEQRALSKREGAIGAELLAEIRRRVGFLLQVGLGYLSLDRSADTLSGGEAQRIRLAAQLGSGLQDVLYVLDEPSIGLHPFDHQKLLDSLRELRDAGNTVVVVEHDLSTLSAADWVIDVGPGAGRHGGRIVAQGTVREVARADSPTGRLLRGEIRFPRPSEERRGDGRKLVLRGARGFNLKGIDFELPLGTLSVVTGLSGSGKSTLVEATLVRALARALGREVPDPEPFDELEGIEALEDVVVVDASPIGRTPRSNPATYVDVLGAIRDLFASLPEARMRGWLPGRFSFNVVGGRCEACHGAGAQLVELQFLAAVTVPCSECGGKRFRAETLEASFKGRHIADVLAMTVDGALAFFSELPKIARPLATLAKVGLGYLALGQPSTTLSGGEAQRVKLAKYLQRTGHGTTLYVLDEPTTGLHPEDVSRLVAALQELVERGNTVLVVEHNLDIVRCADHVIELGPGPGVRGGSIVAQGTPRHFASAARTPTGDALRAEQRLHLAKPGSERRAPRAARARSAIELRGARTHNLKGIDLDLPREKLIVVTGRSGSGKSSLALDTLHAAGRARFVESLSTYARQFLGNRDKPPVDRLEGLGPSVAVEAMQGGSHPRSTVATTTEIHDHLRVLWARAGTRRCPEHGLELVALDPGAMALRAVRAASGRDAWVVAPVFGASETQGADWKAAFEEAREAWTKAGFARVLVDGLEQRLDRLAEPPAAGSTLDLVIDRVRVDARARARLAEAFEQAAGIAGGRTSLLVAGADGRLERSEFSARGACTRCGYHPEGALEPRHFSFNTHVGACPGCAGLGERWQCAPDLLVDRPERALLPKDSSAELAISGKLARYLLKGKGYYEHLLRTVARKHKLHLERPFEQLSDSERALVLRGKGALPSYAVEIEKHGESFDLKENFSASWPGLCGHVDAWHAKSEDPGWRALLETFMRRTSCSACGGERLAPGPRAVTLGDLRLGEFTKLSVAEALAVLDRWKLPADARAAVGSVLGELHSRLELLQRVGLGYLGLERATGTLSSGESRRVRLAASLGAQLVGVTYVLDEPTVGLHPRDIDRLADALIALRDLGNTVISVEHDETLMRRADWIVDMGPGAGRFGGEVVYSGPPAGLLECAASSTGAALAGRLVIARAPAAEPPAAAPARGLLRGARVNNLQGVDLEFAFGQWLGVCGPSGSGKSSLVMDTLVPALQGEAPRGRWSEFRVRPALALRTLIVDAAPLGRTPASIPATAVGLMDPLRELFARTPEAKLRGFTAAHFSFNSNKGRCEACEGKGATLVEMQFLADLWLSCEECGGKRYRPQVLEARFAGHSIADVLALSIAQARDLFASQPAVHGPLEALCSVGLGYLALGQSSTTLSVGEAQRIKLAAELLRAATGERCVVVLDEPSTGLAQADVAELVTVLDRLAARGHAIVLVEHHAGLLSCCDRLLELGPEGGAGGGRAIAAGTPAELARLPDSPTGPYLLAGAERAPQAKLKARGGRRQQVRA